MLNDLSLYYLLIQIFGFVVFGLYATASFHRSRKNFFLQESMGALGMGLQTLLLGSWIAFFTNAIHGLMMLAGRFHPELRISQNVLYGGIAATLLCSLAVWEHSVIHYICVAATLVNFSARTCKNENTLRICSIIGCLMWVIFHALLGSWAGLFFALIAIIGHLNYLIKTYAHPALPIFADNNR